jgi:hypothetical protein
MDSRFDFEHIFKIILLCHPRENGDPEYKLRADLPDSRLRWNDMAATKKTPLKNGAL